MGAEQDESVGGHPYQPYQGRERLWELWAGQGAPCGKFFLWVDAWAMPEGTCTVTELWDASASEQEM